MVCAGLLACGAAAGLGAWSLPGLPWQTWAAGAGFFLLGALDDRFEFQPRQKFGAMAALAALAAWPWAAGTALPGFAGVRLGPWTLRPGLTGAGPLLAFWFLALPNAVNIEDAINGYMGGYTFIILAVLAGRGLPTWIPLGALLGFILLNWPRAIHFMGDAGSLGCGFVLAEAILRGGGLHRPLYALALTAPVSLDVAMGILRRRRLGMSLFEADRSTLPHHVLGLAGGSTARAAGALWANALVFALLAPFPVLVGLYSVVFAGALVALNWPQLHPRGREDFPAGH